MVKKTISLVFAFLIWCSIICFQSGATDIETTTVESSAGNYIVREQYLVSTNDATDRTKEILALLSADQYCQLGEGVFYVTGIKMPADTSLFGRGNATKLILADSVTEGSAIELNSGCLIRDLWIQGHGKTLPLSSSVGSRHGILFNGNASASSGETFYRAKVSSCTISGFSGGGITCNNTGFDVNSNVIVSDSHIYNCTAGINIPYFAEYNAFHAVKSNNNYYGAVVNGGNNVFYGCDISSNTTNILMDNTNGDKINNGHGIFVGCTINHAGGNAGYAIRMLGIHFGEIFTGCQIHYGKIEIARSQLIEFHSVQFGEQTPITVNNSSDVIFNCCSMFSEAATPYSGDSVSVLFSNCRYSNGEIYSVAPSLKITEQPKDTAVSLGAEYSFAVEAAGEGLSYTWYYRLSGDNKYVKSACTSSTYRNKANANVDHMRIYCVVTDRDGNTCISDIATLRVVASAQALQITEGPLNTAVENRSAYTFSCTATGKDLSYAWYYKIAGDSQFTKSAISGSNYTNIASPTVNGMEIYCVVSDQYGTNATSRTATLLVKGTPCQITVQPANQAVGLGKSYTFICGVAGEGLSYTWYYKFPGDSGFTKSSITTASYTNTARQSGSGMQMYCVVKDKYGNTKTSRTATLFVYGAPCQIVVQPVDQTVGSGKTYSFVCGVAGEGLTYEWYYKFPGESGFTKSAVTSATYTNTAKVSGMQMYCVVHDKNGYSATSRTATLTVQ